MTMENIRQCDECGKEMTNEEYQQRQGVCEECAINIFDEITFEDHYGEW